jgi:hypothetical protein
MSAQDNLSSEQFNSHLEWPVETFTKLYKPSEYGNNWEEVPGHRLFGRAGAERQALLEESVKSEGIKEPISVDRMSQRVTDGHHRVIAAMKSGQPIKFQDPNNPYRSNR